MEEVTDEPLYRDRVCGIDIGKAGIAATIRVPSDKDPSRRMAETREFGTTKREVLALADWLRCWQVPAVVMEATVMSRAFVQRRPRLRPGQPAYLRPPRRTKPETEPVTVPDSVFVAPLPANLSEWPANAMRIKHAPTVACP